MLNRKKNLLKMVLGIIVPIVLLYLILNTCNLGESSEMGAYLVFGVTSLGFFGFGISDLKRSGNMNSIVKFSKEEKEKIKEIDKTNKKNPCCKDVDDFFAEKYGLATYTTFENSKNKTKVGKNSFMRYTKNGDKMIFSYIITKKVTKDNGTFYSVLCDLEVNYTNVVDDLQIDLIKDKYKYLKIWIEDGDCEDEEVTPEEMEGEDLEFGRVIISLKFDKSMRYPELVPEVLIDIISYSYEACMELLGE